MMRRISLLYESPNSLTLLKEQGIVVLNQKSKYDINENYELILFTNVYLDTEEYLKFPDFSVFSTKAKKRIKIVLSPTEIVLRSEESDGHDLISERYPHLNNRKFEKPCIGMDEEHQDIIKKILLSTYLSEDCKFMKKLLKIVNSEKKSSEKTEDMKKLCDSFMEKFNQIDYSGIETHSHYVVDETLYTQIIDLGNWQTEKYGELSEKLSKRSLNHDQKNQLRIAYKAIRGINNVNNNCIKELNLLLDRLDKTEEDVVCSYSAGTDCGLILCKNGKFISFLGVDPNIQSELNQTGDEHENPFLEITGNVPTMRGTLFSGHYFEYSESRIDGNKIEGFRTDNARFVYKNQTLKLKKIKKIKTSKQQSSTNSPPRSPIEVQVKTSKRNPPRSPMEVQVKTPKNSPPGSPKHTPKHIPTMKKAKSHSGGNLEENLEDDRGIKSADGTRKMKKLHNNFDASANKSPRNPNDDDDESVVSQNSHNSHRSNKSMNSPEKHDNDDEFVVSRNSHRSNKSPNSHRSKNSPKKHDDDNESIVSQNSHRSNKSSRNSNDDDNESVVSQNSHRSNKSMNSPKKHDDDDESVVSDTSNHSHAKKGTVAERIEEIENKLKQKDENGDNVLRGDERKALSKKLKKLRGGQKN